jgi:hypothetical protein
VQLPGIATFTPGWVQVNGFRPSELGLSTSDLSHPTAILSFSLALPSLPPGVASAIQSMLSPLPVFTPPVVPFELAKRAAELSVSFHSELHRRWRLSGDEGCGAHVDLSHAQRKFHGWSIESPLHLPAAIGTVCMAGRASPCTQCTIRYRFFRTSA